MPPARARTVVSPQLAAAAAAAAERRFGAGRGVSARVDVINTWPGSQGERPPQHQSAIDNSSLLVRVTCAAAGAVTRSPRRRHPLRGPSAAPPTGPPPDPSPRAPVLQSELPRLPEITEYKSQRRSGGNEGLGVTRDRVCVLVISHLKLVRRLINSLSRTNRFKY